MPSGRTLLQHPNRPCPPLLQQSHFAPNAPDREKLGTAERRLNSSQRKPIRQKNH
jgi:hypothetical protein